MLCRVVVVHRSCFYVSIELVVSDQGCLLQASIIDKAGHCSVWFPIRSISKLIMRLDRNPQFSQQHIQLQEAVQQHIRSCIEVSNTLIHKDDRETIVGMEE